MKNKKGIFLICFSVIFAIIVLSILILNFSKYKNKYGNNNLVTSDETYTMYIAINPLVKLTFKEQYKECNDKNSNNKCELSTIITDYELVNEDAKEFYKDIEFNNKDILEVVPLMVDNVYDNNINFTTITVTTNWEDGYDNETISKKIESDSKYKRKHNIVIDKVADINEEEIENQEIISIKLDSRHIRAMNIETLNDKHILLNLTSSDSYSIEIFGKKEVIENIDINNPDTYVDINELGEIDLENDPTGLHQVKVYLNTDENVYYTINPNYIDLLMWYVPSFDMNEITNEEVKAILDKYYYSRVGLFLSGNDNPGGVQCAKENQKVKCHIRYSYLIENEKPTKELFQVYDRFNIKYNSKGFPINFNSHFCNTGDSLSMCLDQGWFEI